MAASLKFLIPCAALMDAGRRFGWLRLAPQRTQVNLYYAVDELARRAAPQLTPSALVPKTAAAHSSMPGLLVVIWACGILFVAVRWWLNWRRVRLAMHSATLLRMFEGIPVLSSPGLRERGLEPGVVGLCRPVMVVPEGIAERLGPAELDAVLAHESFHVRRRDNLAAAVHMAVEAIFWFHPLVWWLGRRIMQERERACDESVLRRRNDPEAYAQGILNVCKFYLESPLPCVSGITGSNLKQRIEEIMTRRLSRELNMARSIVFAVAGCLAQWRAHQPDRHRAQDGHKVPWAGTKRQPSSPERFSFTVATSNCFDAEV
jgi:bla regulator protein BlaR1